MILGGADIVDGSPVLDIKPYVPFCDCLPHARAPEWVQVSQSPGNHYLPPIPIVLPTGTGQAVLRGAEAGGWVSCRGHTQGLRLMSRKVLVHGD